MPALTNSYLQTNLVSAVSGVAANTDPNLVNAWGIAFIGAGPWWVNSAGKGLSIIYQSNGSPLSDFTIPPPSTGGPSVPTGIVSNSTTDFQLTAGHPALFLFATALGTIAGSCP